MSFSEEINSAQANGEEDEEGLDMLGVDLLYQMDKEDITALRKHFFPEKVTEEWRRANPQGLSLSKQQFIRAMETLAGSTVLSLCAAKLFDTLDIDGSGLLQWEEVLDAIMEKTGTGMREIEGSWTPIDPKVAVFVTPHTRGEPIIKIVPLETDTTFCYAVISKWGRVGVYDGEMNLLDSYKLGLKPNEEATRDFNELDSGDSAPKQHRRSTTTFLKDAIFIADNYALLFASSDRSLHLYDATGLVHVPLCHIIGMPNVPVCMDYHSSSEPAKPSLLFVGDDHGDVIVMRFHKARSSLFKKKHPDKLDRFYWMELSDQTEYVTFKIHKKVHSDVVRQISFCADNDTILSCSNDPINTLVIRHLEDRREPYLFKLWRGVLCFQQDRILHALVTGSADYIVRVWNPVVTQRPLACLYGHKSPVVDVRILRFMAAIFSLEMNGILKVWDLHDEFCLMTLQIDFPALKVPGKRIEYGVRSIFPGPSRLKSVAGDSRSNKDLVINVARTSISGSNFEEVETQMSALDFRIRDDIEWQRDSVAVVCCNHVAILRITPGQAELYAGRVEEPSLLPPPTKDHYSSPTPWRPAEPSKTPRGSQGSKSSTKSSESSSSSIPLPGKNGPGSAPLKDIHKRRTEHRIKQEQMHMLVEQGAPHLALELHALQPVTFSRPLPVTRRMRERGVDVSDPERLQKAKIQPESTVISLAVQSGNSSLKSSKSSKSAPIRRRGATSKGRLTPDWFADKIKSRGGSVSEDSFTQNT